MCDNIPDSVIKRAASGDSGAMNEIITFYQKLVYNIACSMLRDGNDALDASQEVFIKIYRHIGEFRFDSSFSTWIYRITRNTVTDICRQKTRRTETPLEDTMTDDGECRIPDPSMAVDEIAEADERKRMLYRAIDSLSENHRNVIVLYHFCGRSYEDIAAILGIGIGTVKSRLNRAKAELKRILTERNFFA